MTNHETDNWLRAAKWGIMAHFLEKPASSPEASETSLAAWNKTVDGFDASAFADDVAEAGAGYAIFTLGQNTGHFCSPNAAYTRLVGPTARCSERDLLADVATELARRGVRTVAYLPSHAPAHDHEAVLRLECTPPWDPSGWGLAFDSYAEAQWADAHLSRFQSYWEEIVREWALRWGDLISGWWIDGCYYWPQMYAQPDGPNFVSFAAALRVGNIRAMLAFNAGTESALKILTPAQDYTAGEMAAEFQCPYLYRPLQPSDPGKALHLLSFLGDWWGSGEPRFDSDFAAGYTRLVNASGGAMTWDVPVEHSGRLAPAFTSRLRAIGEAVSGSQESQG